MPKIQGAALNVIRTLGTDATWADIKNVLVSSFGVRDSYHQLYHQALSARNNNNQVREYFATLRNILNRLNEKYEYDVSKPVEFKPRTNESIILRTFLNNIDPHLASIIITRDIKNLRDAFNMLESLGLIRDTNRASESNNQYYRNVNRNFNNNNQRNFNNNNSNQGSFNRNNEIRNQNPNYNNNTNNNRPQYEQNNNRTNTYQNRDNNSGQVRRTYPNSGQFRNNYQNNQNSNTSKPVLMEVDHFQHEENFQLTPQKYTYQ